MITVENGSLSPFSSVLLVSKCRRALSSARPLSPSPSSSRPRSTN